MRVVKREVVVPWKVELAIAGGHSRAGRPRKGDEENRQGSDSPTRDVISAAEAIAMATGRRLRTETLSS